MKHFRPTLIVLGLTMICLCAGGLSLLGWQQRERERLHSLELNRTVIAGRLAVETGRLSAMRTAHPPVLRFLAAWQPFLTRPDPSRTAAVEMRTALEALAQRRLGLITDQVTTPEQSSILVSGRPTLVQRVCLRASGENLSALLTWLGEAEALYPYARVELCELAAGVGTGVSLRLGLAQPVSPEHEERKSR